MLPDVYNASLFLSGRADIKSERLNGRRKKSAWQRGAEVSLPPYLCFFFFPDWSMKIKPSCSRASCPDWKTRSLNSRVASGGNDTASRLLTQFFSSANESLTLAAGAHSVISGWLSDPLLSLLMPHHWIWEEDGRTRGRGDSDGWIEKKKKMRGSEMRENSSLWKWCCPPTPKHWQTALGRKALSAH